MVDVRGMVSGYLRHWWLVLLGVLAGGLIAAVTFSSGAPVYRSTAKLFVQGGADSSRVTASGIDESRRISQLYGDLATTRPMLEAIAASEDVPFSAGELNGKITVAESRSFIEVSATDADPLMASVVANETAVTLIEELTERQFARLSQFRDSLARLGFDGDPSLVAEQAANLPALSLAEAAAPAEAPISSPASRNTRILAGVILGFVLTSGLAIVRHALDDTIKTEEQVAVTTGVLTLGTIPRHRTPANKTPVVVGGAAARDQLAAEAYNMVRTNIGFSFESAEPVRSILVTGPGPGEGKSTIASNLAASFAREGKAVILVDADLRKPVQHTVFSIEGAHGAGLAAVLDGSVALENAVFRTAVPGLKVLPAGPMTGAPDLFFRGDEMPRLVRRLEQLADVVVYDSPPVLAVADPLLLARQMDLAIMVVEAGATRLRAARRGAKTLSLANVPALAAVLTKQRTGIAGYDRYAGYEYYGYYARSSAEPRSNGRERSSDRVREAAGRMPLGPNGRGHDL